MAQLQGIGTVESRMRIRRLYFAVLILCVSLIALSVWAILPDQHIFTDPEGWVPYVTWSTSYFQVWVREGRFWLLPAKQLDWPPGLRWDRMPYAARDYYEFIAIAAHRPWMNARGSKFPLISLPFWSPALFALLMLIPLLWTWRKHPRTGHCINCGYNLTGAALERCPELRPIYSSD